MPQSDITFDITYDVQDSKKSVIKTNAKKSTVSEILYAWISDQTGKGKDHRKPEIKDFYNIKIELDLSCDSFDTTSDTGNDGLTCGIMMYLLSILSDIQIQPLS